MESSCQTCRQASVVEPYQNAGGPGPLKAVSTRPPASPPARPSNLGRALSEVPVGSSEPGPVKSQIYQRVESPLCQCLITSLWKLSF